MAIHIIWDDPERTILRFENEGEWTWQEFDQKVDEVIVLARSIRGQIAVIAVLAGPLASGYPIPHYQRAWKQLPDNINPVVVVQQDPRHRLCMH
jgi:hypothetical protein